MSNNTISGGTVPHMTDEELEKYGKEHQAEYELDALLAKELDLDEPEVGNGLHAAACADLRKRGVDPDTADQETLLAAYRRAGAR